MADSGAGAASAWSGKARVSTDRRSGRRALVVGVASARPAHPELGDSTVTVFRMIAPQRHSALAADRGGPPQRGRSCRRSTALPGGRRGCSRRAAGRPWLRAVGHDSETMRPGLSEPTARRDVRRHALDLHAEASRARCCLRAQGRDDRHWPGWRGWRRPMPRCALGEKIAVLMRSPRRPGEVGPAGNCPVEWSVDLQKSSNGPEFRSRLGAETMPEVTVPRGRRDATTPPYRSRRRGLAIRNPNRQPARRTGAGLICSGAPIGLLVGPDQLGGIRSCPSPRPR